MMMMKYWYLFSLYNLRYEFNVAPCSCLFGVYKFDVWLTVHRNSMWNGHKVAQNMLSNLKTATYKGEICIILSDIKWGSYSTLDRVFMT